MKRLALSIAFAAVAAVALANDVEFRKVTVTFKDDTVIEGSVVYFDAVGLKLLNQREVVIFYPWSVIRNEEELKRLLGISVTSTDVVATGKTINDEMGVAIETKNGTKHSGKILQELTDTTNLIIKSKGKLIKILRTDISKFQEVPLKLKEIYSDDEIYSRITEGRTFSTQEDHRETAEVCEKAGLPEKAQFHHYMVELADRASLPSGSAYKKLMETFHSAKDDRTRELLYMAGKEILNENYEPGIQRLEQFLRMPSPNVNAESFEMLIKELKILGQSTLEEKVIRAWYFVGTDLVRRKACDREATFKDAVSFVELSVTDAIVKEITSKFNIGASSAKDIWVLRETTEIITASYGDSTWLAESPLLRDPESWWAKAENSSRIQFLEAYYAEKCMQVIETMHKDCPSCGGNGKIKGDKADSDITCANCVGIGRQRVVIFR